MCDPVCVPVFSSISLDLLPERAATLTVYEDVVEIVSGLQGKTQCVCMHHLMKGCVVLFFSETIFTQKPLNFFEISNWFKKSLNRL